MKLGIACPFLWNTHSDVNGNEWNVHAFWSAHTYSNNLPSYQVYNRTLSIYIPESQPYADERSCVSVSERIVSLHSHVHISENAVTRRTSVAAIML
jgi:hypothetical protein